MSLVQLLGVWQARRMQSRSERLRKRKAFPLRKKFPLGLLEPRLLLSADIIPAAEQELLESPDIAAAVQTALPEDANGEPGQAVNRVDSGSISGRKYNDLNADGNQDSDEPGLAGWTMYVDDDRDGQLDASEPRELTDENGVYAFTGLLKDGPGE